jgi:hypothetical protein
MQLTIAINFGAFILGLPYQYGVSGTLSCALAQRGLLPYILAARLDVQVTTHPRRRGNEYVARQQKPISPKFG